MSKANTRFLPTTIVENRPFDEVFDIEDAEEIDSQLAVSPPSSRGEFEFRDQQTDTLAFPPGETPPRSPSSAEPSEYDGDVTAAEMESALHLTTDRLPQQDDSDSHSDHSRSSEELDGSTPAPKLEGAYDPSEYASLNVPQEISELFEYITSFQPEVLELDTKLKPFIPEYIPAVGDIDAFLKIPRPDGVDQGLGLVVLDEPCANQSDSTVLDLHLRTVAKTTTSKPMKLNQIKSAEEDPKAIDNWIRSIAEVHRDKQPQTVHYTSPMPDLETLMQEWPPEVEELLNKVQLPSGDLNVSLQEMTDIVCAIMDIPVQKNRIESLHLLFSLFVEFRNSQHFKDVEDEGQVEETDADGVTSITQQVQ
eukprot:m.32771 g.32771  ORF g.32771 m.32771 type:complete len:364 (-) comp10820_c0_seq1:93-1184(-)